METCPSHLPNKKSTRSAEPKAHDSNVNQSCLRNERNGSAIAAGAPTAKSESEPKQSKAIQPKGNQSKPEPGAAVGSACQLRPVGSHVPQGTALPQTGTPRSQSCWAGGVAAGFAHSLKADSAARSQRNRAAMHTHVLRFISHLVRINCFNKFSS